MEGILARIAIALHIVSPTEKPKTPPHTPIVSRAEKPQRAYCEDDATYQARVSRVYWHDAYYLQKDEDDDLSDMSLDSDKKE